MSTKQLLEEYLEKEKQKIRDTGGEFFLGLPDAWYEPKTTYACINGHISNHYLRSEEKGNVCMSCYEKIYLCPAITEEELFKILNPIGFGVLNIKDESGQVEVDNSAYKEGRG